MLLTGSVSTGSVLTRSFLVVLYEALKQPSVLVTRTVEAGLFFSEASGLIGRVTKLPPQFGQFPLRIFSAQAEQNAHSNEQMRALVACGGKSPSQHSQFGRISSMSCHLRITRFLPAALVVDRVNPRPSRQKLGRRHQY